MLPHSGAAVVEASEELVALVQRALSGDRPAQRELCERQLPLFQRVAAKLAFRFRNVTRETARQEEMNLLNHIVCAFMEELQDPAGVVGRWRPQQGPLEAWLRPFATCRGLDSLRRRKDGRNLPFEALQGAIESDLDALHKIRPGALPSLEERDALVKLCGLILKDPMLGADALRLLERLFWDEEDRELLARSLGLKRNTLDVKLKRIRQRLLELAKPLGLPFRASEKGKRAGSRSGTADAPSQPRTAVSGADAED